jgi:hypothetical protein
VIDSLINVPPCADWIRTINYKPYGLLQRLSAKEEIISKQNFDNFFKTGGDK